jgi:protein-tyrosine phosphatase
MGNICRSPTAEGFFRHHLAHSGLAGQITTDSAGTHSYNLGCTPDPRAISAAAAFGVDISGLRARQVEARDFEAFHLLLAMDHVNLEGIARIRPAGAAGRLQLMMDFDPAAGTEVVPDPYYGQQGDFERMCTLLDGATRKLVAHLERGANS